MTKFKAVSAAGLALAAVTMSLEEKLNYLRHVDTAKARKILLTSLDDKYGYCGGVCVYRHAWEDGPRRRSKATCKVFPGCWCQRGFPIDIATGAYLGILERGSLEHERSQH